MSKTIVFKQAWSGRVRKLEFSRWPDDFMDSIDYTLIFFFFGFRKTGESRQKNNCQIKYRRALVTLNTARKKITISGTFFTAGAGAGGL